MAIIETHSTQVFLQIIWNPSEQKAKIWNLLGCNICMVPNDMVKQLGILLALQGTALG